MDAWVEIVSPEGTSQRHRLEPGETTIGRSPMAGIPLVNVEELEGEHLLLSPRPDGCWVAVAEGAEPGAVIDGDPFTHGVVPYGTEVRVGSTLLRITDKEPVKQVASDRAISTPVLVLVVVLLPLSLWMLLEGGQGAAIDEKLPAVPPVFSDTEQECPESGGSVAATQARRAAEAASHKRERYAFAAQDGIEAVRLYAVAEGCFHAAGEARDAARMKRAKNALVQRIEEDYRTHRLRLDRALKNRDYQDALRETRAIQALLAHRDGTFLKWLEGLERKLQLRVDLGSGDG
jgi:hypothetical protein